MKLSYFSSRIFADPEKPGRTVWKEIQVASTGGWLRKKDCSYAIADAYAEVGAYGPHTKMRIHNGEGISRAEAIRILSDFEVASGKNGAPVAYPPAERPHFTQMHLYL